MQLTTAAKVVALAAVAGLSCPAVACTVFLLARGQRALVAKSYDWPMGQGLVVANKRGVEKQALTLDPRDVPARWVSRFASLTFNQYGRELPNGGINDTGLVIEVLWLEASRFAAADARPTVNELQLVQYLLDTAATVDEAVARAESVRVALVHGKVHYFVCDATTACAALELLGGRLRVSRGSAMPVKALANDTYADSIAALQRGGRLSGMGSLARFARAAARSREPGSGGDATSEAFAVLDSVYHGGTQWNIVYDLGARRVYFRTRAAKSIKWVDLTAFAASCDVAAEAADLDLVVGGDARSRFVPASVETNLGLVSRSFAGIAGELPPGTLKRVAAYPEALRCVATAAGGEGAGATITVPGR